MTGPPLRAIPEPGSSHDDPSEDVLFQVLGTPTLAKALG